MKQEKDIFKIIKGDDGTSIVDVFVNKKDIIKYIPEVKEGHLVVETDDEEFIDAGNVIGKDGKDGKDGEDGKNYILTNKDKREIAGEIVVPIVEKIIERTETIKEIPIITNEIKEVSKYETPQEIVKKIESLEGQERLSAKAIKGLEAFMVEGPRAGATKLTSLSDTDIVEPINGQILVYNQGKSQRENKENLVDRYKTSSTTSQTIVASGSLTFTVDSGLAYIPEQDVIIVANSGNHMHATVTSYSGTTLVVEVKHKTGDGTYSNWLITLDGIAIPGSAVRGEIDGTLSSQTDLQDELDNKQNLLPIPTTGVGSSTTNPAYALQDNTILYHSLKWFTPSGTVSSSGTTVTSVGTQFTVGMVGAKLTINGEWRIITGFTSTTVVTVGTAYSTNYSGVSASNWGVYSKEREIVDGYINQYSFLGLNYLSTILDDTFLLNNVNTVYKVQPGTNGNTKVLSVLDIYGAYAAFIRADGTILGKYVGTRDNHSVLLSETGGIIGKGVSLSDDSQVTWTTYGPYYTTKDIGLRRNSAGILEVYDGTNPTGLLNNRRDLLLRDLLGESVILTKNNGGVTTPLILSNKQIAGVGNGVEILFDGYYQMAKTTAKATPTAGPDAIYGIQTFTQANAFNTGFWFTGLSNALLINTTTDDGVNKLQVNGGIKGTDLKTNGYTVATLPTGVTGMRVYVTDALAPAFLGILVGGGSVICPAFFNGTNWVCC